MKLTKANKTIQNQKGVQNKMTLYFEDEGDLTLDLPYEELAKEVIYASLDYVACPYEVQVGLLLTMNEEIHAINLEQREIDKPTDVLSFPMLDYEVPGVFAFLEEDEMHFDPESGELPLGDIVISKEKVVSQAEEFGHSVKREFAFLIAHSMLHLFGFDHMEENERIEMEQMQRDILEGLKILR